ncbi:uncharacterized protein KY384_008583 [Bacidia gigantensis]|uniref:uncharacterized protein n=1 Tax=Bacidia gigantensis TaxID=2732470 RepID=UPI001D03C930|nr:uncharacterized protein KY384_008583 [Bacidia gigantensis]KAG8527153.1 hypothetical protein KY384_008583 [Bacidia gigantensis]
MQLPIIFLLLFTIFGKLAESATLAQQLCATKMGTSSVKSVPTQTYALTLTLTKQVKVTSTPVTTVTPAAVTTTGLTTAFTTVTITGPTSTDTTTTTLTSKRSRIHLCLSTLTASLLDTDTSTITSTTTQTATQTNTITTTTSGTSTISAPAGFTAIKSDPDYVPKIKARDVLGLAARAAAPQQIVVKLANGKPVVSPQLFPTAVICGRLVETVTTKTATVTATSTSTVNAATPTSTVTSTTTSTSTSTIIPDRVTATATATTSTTVTTSTGTTVQTTTTITATEVATIPTATTYAACQPNNIATTANGGKTINEVDGGSGNHASFTSGSSPYDCCVACITSSDNCRAFVYLGLGNGYDCELLIGSSCDPGVAFGGTQFRTSPSTTTAGIPVGNGKCGIVGNGGTGQT